MRFKDLQRWDLTYNQSINFDETKKSEPKYPLVKLGEICEINKHTINPALLPNQKFVYIDIEAVENSTGKISTNKLILGKNAPSRARRCATDNSVIISTVRPNLKGFAYIEKEIPNAVFSTGFSVIKSISKNLSSKFIFALFMHFENLMEQMVLAMPKGHYPSINKSDMEKFQIPLPPLEIQEKIVADIEKFKEKISNAQAEILNLKEKETAILESCF